MRFLGSLSEQFARINAEEKESEQRTEQAEDTTSFGLEVLRGLNQCPALPEICEVKDGTRTCT